MTGRRSGCRCSTRRNGTSSRSFEGDDGAVRRGRGRRSGVRGDGTGHGQFISGRIVAVQEEKSNRRRETDTSGLGIDESSFETEAPCLVTEASGRLTAAVACCRAASGSCREPVWFETEAPGRTTDTRIPSPPRVCRRREARWFTSAAVSLDDEAVIRPDSSRWIERETVRFPDRLDRFAASGFRSSLPRFRSTMGRFRFERCPAPHGSSWSRFPCLVPLGGVRPSAPTRIFLVGIKAPRHGRDTRP